MERALCWVVAAMSSGLLVLLPRMPAAAADTGSADKSPDFAFMQKADEIDMAEVKLGKLAEDRATAEAVKTFGERMVADHSRMNDELSAIARKQGVRLPNELDHDHQALFDQLSKLHGIEFDRAYAKDMAAGHKKAIEKFKAEAKNGQDAALKAWANQSLPTLREHLKLAENAVNEVKREALIDSAFCDDRAKCHRLDDNPLEAPVCPTGTDGSRWAVPSTHRPGWRQALCHSDDGERPQPFAPG